MSPINTSVPVSGDSSNGGSVSPRQTATPKNVAFELLFLESPQYRARLPMRVQIYPHDTTDSIVTTVKNFYGLYSGPTGSKGVSFEDQHGNTLIARYENFRNNMVVYVRVIEESPAPPATGYSQHTFHQPSIGPAESYYEEDSYQPQQQQAQRYSQDIARPSSRTSRRRSPSPNGSRGRRSDSASTSEKQGRSRSAKDRRAFNHANSDAYSDSINGYSSGDGAPSSASGKSKEQLGTTDISVENIVEGGRRKRAKFESSVRNASNKQSITPTAAAHLAYFDKVPQFYFPFSCLVAFFFSQLIVSFHAGIALVRTASDACGHFQSFGFARSPCGAPTTIAAVCASWAAPICEPSADAIATKLYQCPASHVRYACTWPSFPR